MYLYFITLIKLFFYSFRVEVYIKIPTIKGETNKAFKNWIFFSKTIIYKSKSAFFPQFYYYYFLSLRINEHFSLIKTKTFILNKAKVPYLLFFHNFLKNYLSYKLSHKQYLTIV